MDGFIISKKIDVLGLSLSGIAVFLLLKILNADSMFYIGLALVISVVLDNGHVYMTYSRVKKEFKVSPLFFVAVPVLIIGVFTIWMYSQIPYFWSFVVYFTFFHFIRQIFGINRWYMAKEKNKSRAIDFFVYALVLVPILSIHFNPHMTLELYTSSDFFTYKSDNIFIVVILINILMIIGWLISEYKSYKKTRIFNKYRILFVASSAVLFTLVGYFANNYVEVLVPIMMSHGFQYLILSSDFENRVHNKNLISIFVVLLFIGIVFGGMDTYLQELFDMDNTYMHESDFLTSLLLSVLLTPLFSHYIYDMKIWKSNYILNLNKKEK